MTVEQYRVGVSDGLELYCKTWRPDSGEIPKARILFVHGFSEYIDSYDTWFAFFTASGYEVTSYDQRGHGLTVRSKKEYGMSNEKLIMSDLETMVDYVSRGYDGPLVLYGFSMGGAIVLNYMVLGKQRERFNLYISAGPYIATHPSTAKGLNALKLSALPYVIKIMPNYVDKVTFDPSNLTNDPNRWKQYENNPLHHCKSSAIFMHDAVSRGARLLDPTFIRSIVDRPLLLSFGLADGVCDPEASKKFFNMVPLTDKTLDPYEGLPHELMHCVDKNRRDHWNRVHEWLDSHVAKLVAQVDK